MLNGPRKLYSIELCIFHVRNAFICIIIIICRKKNFIQFTRTLSSYIKIIIYNIDNMPTRIMLWYSNRLIDTQTLLFTCSTSSSNLSGTFQMLIRKCAKLKYKSTRNFIVPAVDSKFIGHNHNLKTKSPLSIIMHGTMTFYYQPVNYYYVFYYISYHICITPI